MKKIKPILTLIFIILLIGTFSFITYQSNRTIANPPGTLGNTAGNLYNNGLFCENEGKVYFSNPYDDNTLYVMNPDETEIEKLSTVGVSSLNAAGNYVYFYQGSTGEGSSLGYTVKTTGMYRMTKNGKKSLCLKREPVAILNLIDNEIYYQHFLDTGGLNLEKISMDKSSESILLEGIVSPACVMNEIIYYSNYNENLTLYSSSSLTIS